jgi:mannitol/fructose-specific phosphotransferase system IIA component (Ntr-type)
MLGDADGFAYPLVELPPSAVASPEAAVKFLVNELVRLGRLRPENAARVTSQVVHRESLGSTGVGRGVALPHSKSNEVGEVLGVVGRSAVPVPWPGAMDEEPVRVVCLLITPASEPDASFRALEAAARQLRQVSAGGL